MRVRDDAGHGLSVFARSEMKLGVPHSLPLPYPAEPACPALLLPAPALLLAD